MWNQWVLFQSDCMKLNQRRLDQKNEVNVFCKLELCIDCSVRQLSFRPSTGCVLKAGSVNSLSGHCGLSLKCSGTFPTWDSV